MPPGEEADYHGRHSKTEFCRTCTDFRSWAKLHTGTKKPDSDKQNVSPSTESGSSTGHRSDCPLDKDELGSATWGFLHTMAAYYPEEPGEEHKTIVSRFFSDFSKLYPCESCATHFSELISQNPPEVKNQHTLTQWLCWAHNKVNQRVGKPIFDCSKVNERWRTGWKDGSCD